MNVKVKGEHNSHVGGKSEKVANKMNVESTDADLSLASNKKIAAEGNKPGEAVPEPPPQFVEEVEKISIKTLDKGSSNDGSGGEKDGLVYENTYELEVVKFKDDKAPRNESEIRWAFGYSTEPTDEHSLGEVVVGQLAERGKKIEFEANNLAMCGRDITFYAYINRKEEGGSLEVFHHYRFRWFDRSTVEKEVKKRVEEPWRIKQGDSSLCGMACIFYLMAKQDGEGYKKFVMTLHQRGEAEYNGYAIKPGNTFYQDSFFDMDPQSSDYPPKMPQADWIALASTRNHESTFYAYEGKAGEDFNAVNWPGIMVKLKEKLLDYTEVVDKTDFFMNPDTSHKLGWLIEMQKAWQEGYKISVLIDSDMLEDSPTYFANFNRWHWIVYEGNIWIDEAAGTYTFSYWCWGKEPIKKAFRKAVFNTNYYGYIKGK